MLTNELMLPVVIARLRSCIRAFSMFESVLYEKGEERKMNEIKPWPIFAKKKNLIDSNFVSSVNNSFLSRLFDSFTNHILGIVISWMNGQLISPGRSCAVTGRKDQLQDPCYMISPFLFLYTYQVGF